jgi:hypothetical protein
MPNPAGMHSLLAAVLAGWSALALAQLPTHRILRPIDESPSVTLPGNVHPLSRAEFDQGPVGAEMRLERMMLQLEPSASRQAALDVLVEAQHDPQSPLFQHWLTPAEFGERFGASVTNLHRVSVWLASHGFQVDKIPASNRLIVFSGTAGQVADTFHTEIHRFRVDGVDHIANTQSPQILASLVGVVGGVVSLHDFRRTSALAERRFLVAQAVHPEYSVGSTHYLFPADFATIYGLVSH